MRSPFKRVGCGAPEWTRVPRLPLVGEERDHVVATVQAAIAALGARRR